MPELLNETYRVQETVGNHTVTLYVDISSDDEVTVKNDKRQPQFVFTKSNPDLVAAMAKAFETAAKIVADKKVTSA